MIQPEPVNTDVEALLEYLKRTRGFDFTAYKRGSLIRRIQKQLQLVKIESYTDYIDYLEVHPEEFTSLFNTILINVTDFFRDLPAWEVVVQDILPRILDSKKPEEPVRVWSAGCAAGQEAYTLAMVLSEKLGEEAFHQRAKIYGTDADEEALNEARLASYSPQQVHNVPPELREKYFESVDGRSVFRKDLRRSIIFGRHDLLQDAPISRIDLLVCRNTLMYFNAEAQSRILTRFDFALNGGGFLFLGKAEVLLTRSSAFIPIDLKGRIFGKLAKTRPRDLVGPLPENGGEPNPEAGNHQGLRLRELTMDLDPVAQVTLDTNGRLVLTNAQARMLFGLTVSDLGQRLQDLQLAYRPVELRLMIEQAVAERRALTIKEIEWLPPNGEKRYLDVAVMPLIDSSNQRLGVKIIFNDVTRYKRLQDELHQSRQELETANEELQSANEELETTNEELQSTIEELETTNEELQSTNEEMETMNEELQSTNEELQTINEELRQRGEELKGLNAFLESIMASLQDGVVVVNRDLQITAWNHKAEDLWGLRAAEVRGKSFLNLDIGLPVEQLKRAILACLSGKNNFETTQLAATNRRGKSIQLQVDCNRLVGANNDTHGVIVIMQEKRLEAESP